MMPLRAAMPNTVRKPTSEPSEMDPRRRGGRHHPADQRRGQRQEDDRRQAPAAESGLQEQEDAERGGDREAEQALLGGLALGEVAEQLGVVFARELDRGQRRLDVGDDRADVPPAHTRGDVDVARDGVMLDDVRFGTIRTSATSPRRTWSPLGVSMRSSRTLVQAVARLGHADHHHLEDLLFFEEVADLDARQQGGGRAADVARLEPVLLGRGQVDLDLDLRLLDLEVDAGVDDAVGLRHDLPNLLRLVAEDLQVLAVDAHDDGVARSRQYFPDPLIGIGQQLVESPG